MNPGARLQQNVFYFGRPNKPPRVVLFGPYLYVHAPGVQLPRGVESISEEERRAKHLGALHARVRLADDPSLQLVRKIARQLAPITGRKKP